MKKNKNYALVVVTIVLSLLMSILGCSDEKMTLLAQDPVPVYKSQEDALTGNRNMASGYVSKGEQVLVLKCIDVKHYQIYKVQLSNGVGGYVNEGDYLLLKAGKKSAC
jgi:hypothetical protein